MATKSIINHAQSLDRGLACLSSVAGYYRVAADPAQLRHHLALSGHPRADRSRRESSAAEVAHHSRRERPAFRSISGSTVGRSLMS
jgi:ABC-type bacteriocin/lantibiotic exporter with double-glycine peptidase domain